MAPDWLEAPSAVLWGVGRHSRRRTLAPPGGAGEGLDVHMPQPIAPTGRLETEKPTQGYREGLPRGLPLLEGRLRVGLPLLERFVGLPLVEGRFGLGGRQGGHGAVRGPVVATLRAAGP